jgi:hypothetical protein
MQQAIDRHSKYNELPHYSVELSISTHQWLASHAADFEESIFDARITAQHQTLTALNLHKLTVATCSQAHDAIVCAPTNHLIKLIRIYKKDNPKFSGQASTGNHKALRRSPCRDMPFV